MDATPPDYNTIFFDSNELLANGWPDTSVKLSNLLYVGQGWGIVPVIPQAVMDETEAHWIRTIETKAAALSSAKKEFERLARPVICEVRIEHTEIDQMRERYRVYRKQTIERFGIQTIPYPPQAAEFFFHRASRYVAPFEKEGEGKGFQDSVILQSVLEYLQADGQLKGILLTKDGGMKQARIQEFAPGFDLSRLRFSTLDDAWENLYLFNFNQTVAKPWSEERANALAAARAMQAQLKEFLSANLTEPMLRAGGFGYSATVVKLISIDSIDLSFVDTPIPGLYEHPDREVKIAISVSVQCTALVKKEKVNFFSAILGDCSKEDNRPPEPPEFVQEKAAWSGGIVASAKIINHDFIDIVPEALVSDEELRARKEV